MSTTTSDILLSTSASGALGTVAPVGKARRTLGPTAVREESLLEFVRWLAAQLALPVRTIGSQLEITLPEEDRELFGGRPVLSLSVVRGRVVMSPSGPDEQLARGPQVEPLRWLLDRLAQRGPAATRPQDQPVAVHAITQKLFGAYRVDGGQMHLAGCQLEDRPFVRLSYNAGTTMPGMVRHLFVGPDGSSVPDELATALGLARVIPVLEGAPRLGRDQLQMLVAAGERMAAQRMASRDPKASAGKPLAVAVVWTKYARGRLQFSIGENAVTLPFDGWASTLVAPPWCCPHTGVETFHLAAVDDGRIVAAEQVATCEQSGRRVLADEVVTCRATGRRLLPEFTTRCPVLAEPVESDHFAACTTCGERVSTPALKQGVCAACRHLLPLAADDPRLIWLASQYPELVRWKWLRLAETETCYIVRAAGLLRRMLVVLDRESLAIRRVAKGSRGSRQWTPQPPEPSSLSRN